MKDLEKEVITSENEQKDAVQLSDEKLKKVTGGGLDDVPTVPEYPIDDDVKDKF